MKSVCIFCGHSKGHSPVYAEAAQATGKLLATEQIELIYGGGSRGLMGVVADAALAAGGYVVGVIPEFLNRMEVGHKDVQELLVVKTMHERKQLMADRAEGFMALPGGVGTMDELCEILTWAQLGLHNHPVGLLDIDGFYQPLITFFDEIAAKGFLPAATRARVLTDSDPERLLRKMQAWKGSSEPQLMHSDQV
ncbi:MAG: TIGR00730 family Rossman fold protein [Bacteroidetes bacterium]|nr:MAG: TIGR00730 family Rossman fold protein [Bacteroidota bacterium]